MSEALEQGFDTNEPVYSEYPNINHFIIDFEDEFNRLADAEEILSTSCSSLSSEESQVVKNMAATEAERLGLSSRNAYMSRADRRRNINTPFAVPMVHFGISYAKYREISLRKNDEVVPVEEFIQGTISDKPLQELARGMVEEFTPEAVAHADITSHVRASLREHTIANPALRSEIVTLLRDAKNSTVHEQGLIYLVTDDYYQCAVTGDTSIVKSIMDEITDQTDAYYLNLAIEEIETFGEDTEVYKVIALVKALSGVTEQQSLADLLSRHTAYWPQNLERYVSKFKTKELQAINFPISNTINQSGKKWQLSLPPSIDTLNFMWAKVISMLPPENLSPVGRKLKAASHTGHIATPKIVKLDDQLDRAIGSTVEQNGVNRKIAILKRNHETSLYEQTTALEETSRTLVDVVGDFCEPYGPKLKDALYRAFSYLQTTLTPAGVKAMSNLRVRLENGTDDQSVKSFKPTVVAGLSGPPIFRKVRIEYVMLEDGDIGLLNINIRNDSKSGNRKYA